MSATGLPVFDKSIQTTNIWLDEIMDDLGPDRQNAYHVLRAVLHALRDRLTPEEMAHLGAQLPLVVRGIYYDEWRPSDQPSRQRHADEFLATVEEGLSTIRPVNVRQAVGTVFKVLEHHVTPGEIDDVKHMLPADIRALWPGEQ